VDVIFDIFECFPDVLNGQHISIFLLINGLKIVLTFHPLPTLPPQGGGTSYNPLSLGGRARVRGDHLCLTIVRLLINSTDLLYYLF
jgi:hypothetical protein